MRYKLKTICWVVSHFQCIQYLLWHFSFSLSDSVWSLSLTVSYVTVLTLKGKTIPSPPGDLAGCSCSSLAKPWVCPKPALPSQGPASHIHSQISARSYIWGSAEGASGLTRDVHSIGKAGCSFFGTARSLETRGDLLSSMLGFLASPSLLIGLDSSLLGRRCPADCLIASLVPAH